jgi:copper chaperone
LAKKENAMNNQQETFLDVKGMGCPSCVSHIDEALSEVDGVSAVEVRLREGRVLVRHEPAKVSTAKLVAALRNAGYESSPSG